MSDSVRPHGLQPTRLLRPWDSPGKNTGVGCHCLLQFMKVESESEVAQSCPLPVPHGLQPTRLLHPWDFLGNSTGVGCHCLLQNFTRCLLLNVMLKISYTFYHKKLGIFECIINCSCILILPIIFFKLYFPAANHP